MRREKQYAQSLKALSDALKALCAPESGAVPQCPVSIATAEASTGGLLAATLTEAAGSSAYFERGFNVYSNASKVELLGLSEELLQTYGAVSAECTTELALGALEHSHATLAIAVSGISGPAGGTPEKPVGLTYITLALKGKPALKRLQDTNSPLRHYFESPFFEEQGAVLLYTGALQFLFTGKEEATSLTEDLREEATRPLADAKQGPHGAVSATCAGAFSDPENKDATAGEGVISLSKSRLQGRSFTWALGEAPKRQQGASAGGALPCSAAAPEDGHFLPAPYRVEVVLPRPSPQDYLIHSEAYALRARLQEATVREALAALNSCLKGEPLLDYVEYINKVNFQDKS